MFFIMGITDGRKDFDFHQMMTCGACGAYGRYQVFMTYTVLSLFFIPCIKWNRHYYVQASCCNALYELDAEIGNGLRAAGMSRFCHNICVRCIRGIVETAGIPQNSAEIVGLRPRRIMNSVRNAVCGFDSGTGIRNRKRLQRREQWRHGIMKWSRSMETMRT